MTLVQKYQNQYKSFLSISIKLKMKMLGLSKLCKNKINKESKNFFRVCREKLEGRRPSRSVSKLKKRTGLKGKKILRMNRS